MSFATLYVLKKMVSEYWSSLQFDRITRNKPPMLKACVLKDWPFNLKLFRDISRLGTIRKDVFIQFFSMAL